MRYLAIDLGDKRTGIAAGDDVTRIVSPVEVLETPIGGGGGAMLLEQLSKLIAEHTPDAIVVGLPMNMDETEGAAAKKAREFGAKLEVITKRPIVYQDERLTSADADWAMAQSGLTHKQKKQRRDALAACAILRDFLSGRATPGA